MTPYERAGIAWWNGLSQRDRARWFKAADTCVIAEAYACYVALMDAFDGCGERRIAVGDLAKDDEAYFEYFGGDPA